MKILQIIADGRPGGGTTHVLTLMRDLVERGNEVYFITQGNSYAVKRARELGVRVRGLDFFFSCLDLRVPWKLGRLADSVEPELIHVHGSRAGFFFSLASSKISVPIVYTVHGYHFPHKRPLIRSLALLAERQASKKVHAHVFVSEHDRRLSDVWSLSPRRGRKFVVYNGIEDIPIVTRTGVNLRSVGFLGRLEYQRDPFLFVQTLRLLVRGGYSAKIIGGGSLENEVSDLIERYGLRDRVKLLGHLVREDALREISDVGTVLFTSRWEGMPIAVMEAMSLRIPVVAPNVGGIPEIVDDGISGILVKDRDPRHFAEAVERVTTNMGFRERIIEAAWQDVRDRFHHTRTAQRYLEIYHGLVHEREVGIRILEPEHDYGTDAIISMPPYEDAPRPVRAPVGESRVENHKLRADAASAPSRRWKL